MQAKSISVVIPNYNGKHLLQANLKSVYDALNFVNADFEIIIVDDASTDDSVPFIKQHYPEVKLLVNEKNKGFSSTINRGIFEAKKTLVFALNNDVTLKHDYFTELFKYFEKPDTFGVMGKIVGASSEEKIQDGAKYPVVTAKGIKGSYNYIPLQAPEAKWLPSFFISGANALMDREKLLQLGGFDEIYTPYYFEDTDLGLRAWRVGWKCYFEPKSVCLHELSSTISKEKKEKVKVVIERNKIVFNNLHLDGLNIHLFNTWLWMRCAAALLRGDKNIYKAINLFQENRSVFIQSKERLKSLQKKNNVFFTSTQVKQEILSLIGEMEIKIF